MTSIAQALRQAREPLIAMLGLEPSVASLEAHVLLGHAIGQSRTYLLANPEQVLDVPQEDRFGTLLQRRLQGEPIAYLLGEREFFGLNLKVTCDVLIPRPETELLVELALERLPPGAALQVLDLGTGSGAIALALASQRPAISVTALDASPAALDVARQNAQALYLHNVRFAQSDWFSALPPDARFDLIVSNPPYIAESDPHLRQGDVRFEPLNALRSGVDGLADIRKITATAHSFLSTHGWLLFEHGYDQAPASTALLQQQGYVSVSTWPDLAGRPRVSGGSKS